MKTALGAMLILGCWTGVAVSSEDAMTVGPFGRVMLYQSGLSPSTLILFVSGDGGWNLGVAEMARALSQENALVAGIDITRYLASLNRRETPCVYPAADFESLSKFVQKQRGVKSYLRPVLIGYSSGATLVYAALAQAPPNTFLGAISLGFCPDLPLNKPLCRGYGLEWTRGPKGLGVALFPAKHLQQPWIALQGTIDQVCQADATKAYVAQVPKGEVIMLPKVGHGFSVRARWMPQLREAVSRITAGGQPVEHATEPSLADLPLIELPTEGSGNVLAVIVSGDGGWASLDRDVGNDLVRRGVPVVGLNSLRYFWSPRTPDEASKDLDRIVSHYLSAWKKETVVLIGYSSGADVLPFMVNRLPPATRLWVKGLVLLGPSSRAQFEFHVTDWFGLGAAEHGTPVLPELDAVSGIRVLCLAGTDERDSLCRSVDRTKIHVELLPGGHHFSGDYERVGRFIAETMGLD